MTGNKYTKFAKDTLVFAAGNIITKIVYFVMVPLYTSTLSTAQYGVAEMLNTIIDIVYPVVTICIVDALYRFAMDDDANISQVFGFSFRLVGLSVVLVTVACVVLYLFTRQENYLLFLLLYASYCLYKLFLQLARGLGYNVRFSSAGVVNALVLVGMNLLLLLVFHGGIRSYIISIIVANLVAALYIFLAAKEYRYLSRHQPAGRELRRAMIRFALPTIPSTLSWWIINASDRYLLLLMVSESSCGTFTAASKLPSLISTFSMIFQQAWQYSIIKERKSKDNLKFYSDIFNVYSTFLICMTAVVILCTDVLCKIILQKDFYDGRFVLPILMAAAVYICYSGYFDAFFIMVKKNVMSMVATVTAAILNIGLNILLIPRFTGLGAAYATLLCNIVGVTIRVIASRKYAHISVNVPLILLQNGLLIAEAVVMTLDFRGKYYIAAGLLLIILAVSTRTIAEIVKRVAKFCKNHLKRKSI